MKASLTRKILVPVDGSELAERALRLAEWLVLDGRGELKLVRVVPHAAVNDALKGKDVFGSAKGYLACRRGKLYVGVKATTALIVGDPAEEILSLAESWKPTLVAMSTHGRRGVERLVRGSVAERVLRECRFPLLLANPFGLEAAEKAHGFRRILVPLDGSTRASEILPFVREIAKSSNARSSCSSRSLSAARRRRGSSHLGTRPRRRYARRRPHP